MRTLTIKDLKKAIENLPDDMKVCIGGRMTEYDYGQVNTAKVEECHAWDDVELCPAEEIFVLSED